LNTCLQYVIILLGILSSFRYCPPLLEVEGGDGYEKAREISFFHHNTPYYRDFNHVNKNSTNYLSRY